MECHYLPPYLLGLQANDVIMHRLTAHPEEELVVITSTRLRTRTQATGKERYLESGTRLSPPLDII